jgi:hypothetical protein
MTTHDVRNYGGEFCEQARKPSVIRWSRQGVYRFAYTVAIG